MACRPGELLFADDSEDDRILMVRALREAGVDLPVVEFEDGAEVVAHLEKAVNAPPERRPCLAILDLKMPRMTGLETLEWIRLSKAWGALPVLILTSSLDPGDRERSYRYGANAYLVKPTKVEELIEVARAIDQFWFRQASLP